MVVVDLIRRREGDVRRVYQGALAADRARLVVARTETANFCFPLHLEQVGGSGWEGVGVGLGVRVGVRVRECGCGCGCACKGVRVWVYVGVCGCGCAGYQWCG